jgi:uncharacterized membrane protein YgaE (UPF0421/DUF939 family)
MAHHAARKRLADGSLTRWADRIAGSDPGFNRLRAALMSTATIGLVLLAEWVFVRTTHALQIQVPPHVGLPAAKAAKLAMVNHEFVVVAMLVGAIVGLITTFIADATASGQAISTLAFSTAIIPAFAAGDALGRYRVASLVAVGAFLVVTAYSRRWGPRGVVVGMGLFFGYFLGFFLHAAIMPHQVGWFAAEVGIGAAVALVIRLVFFFPHHEKALRRALRSYRARANKIAALALQLFDDPDHGERSARRLRHHLVRLNEAALIIDGQLGQPGSTRGSALAERLHQDLFDAELALTNLARFAHALAVSDLPDRQRAEVRQALFAITRQDTSGARRHAGYLLDMLPAGSSRAAGAELATIVLQRRFSSAVIAFTDDVTDWLALGQVSEATGAFRTPVRIIGGWLPGAAGVSSVASAEPGNYRGGRIRLAHYTRAAIQMAVAAGAAIALGDWLNGTRWYWAALAAFVTFGGTVNTGEQARKAFQRVLGTAVGIGLGSLLVDRAGGNTDLLVTVALVSLFVGFYLFRISYAYMVVAITMTIAVLYDQLGEYTNALLVLRLEETAVGGAVTLLVVLLILPLHNRRVLRVAMRQQIAATKKLTQHAVSHLLGEDHDGDWTLRADARAVDVSYQALVAAARPVARNLFGGIDDRTNQVLTIAAAFRNYSQNLVADVEAAGGLDTATRPGIKAGNAALQQSLDVVAGAVTGSRDVTYTRSSALFDRAERRLEERSSQIGPARLAIRDLEDIDGTMATLAKAIGLAITDYDTALASGQDGPGNWSGNAARRTPQHGCDSTN